SPIESGRLLVLAHSGLPFQRGIRVVGGLLAQGHRRLGGTRHRRARIGGQHGRTDRGQGVLSVSLTLTLVIATIAIALFFDFTNGFHDAANAIATSVSTRALTPRLALLMAAILNFLGALLGVGVANTIAEMLKFPAHLDASHALTIVASALVGAIVWNLITWYFGIPSSSSHALIGGLVGVGVAAAGVGVHWNKLVDKVAIPMVASPLIGFVCAFL